jgi:hypothetical protein
MLSQVRKLGVTEFSMISERNNFPRFHGNDRPTYYLLRSFSAQSSKSSEPQFDIHVFRAIAMLFLSTKTALRKIASALATTPMLRQSQHGVIGIFLLSTERNNKVQITKNRRRIMI